MANIPIIYKPVSWTTGFYIMGTLVVKRLNDLELSTLDIIYNVKNFRIISSKNDVLMPIGCC